MDNNMLSRRPTSVHRGEANLLALVLVIGIVAIMVVGVMSFASNISDSNNIQAEYSNGSTIITNARARLKTDGIYDFSGAADMTGTFVQLGGAPKGMIVGNKSSGSATLKNQFGGSVTLAPSTSNGAAKAAFTVTYNAYPYEACTQLATQMSGAPGVVTTAINGTSNSGVVSAANAGRQCVADSGSTGTNTLAFTTNS
ncbi:prepilin [Salmonella enterica subsp. enterica]|uniref:Prepilin n=4 Tax=Salmonella enterica TaxID=28901 RepID=A0A702EVL1_SALTM|nr:MULTISPECIES: type 4 pilus major pilin [Enterobacteriaceae]EAA2765145.1 prepilin [Salmonella enterica subsp. enterica serovar Oranienburg]EAA7190284.1 prepilin [Salmonella enterica subsp. enterica serovar Napoli]EAB5927696.1 prepilin [Salmonella enterica subsp. enterica serovar Newport]EAV2917490.1 prepilin [Salmonella enterica]EBS5920220.1 prepilin [Salmonella enterica subsp. enterica serovar Bispebjerg]EBV5225585.1 prepilin [Salmonella enterica subsp. enterica serovar Litchfield]EBW3316